MNSQQYWQDLDSKLEELVEYGSVKLPSIKEFDLNVTATDISRDMESETWKELGYSHQKFLENLGVERYLTPRLFELAQKVFKFKGKIEDQYHIARKVEPGNSKEQYRAHFDSHLFTMVLPISIPEIPDSGSSGELIYFPKARKMPRNELTNFFGKSIYKRFASKKGIENFSIEHEKKIETFLDYKPIIFMGNTTLHTNYPVSSNCNSYRLTLLAHFFDPSPKYGVGSLLRFLRNR